MNHYRYHLRYISWIKWDSGSGDWWNIAVLLAPSMHVFQLCHLFPKSEPVRIACISPSRSLIWNLSFPTKLLLLLFNWNKASRRQGDEALLQPRNHQTLPHYHSTTSTSTPFFFMNEHHTITRSTSLSSFVFSLLVIDLQVLPITKQLRVALFLFIFGWRNITQLLREQFLLVMKHQLINGVQVPSVMSMDDQEHRHFKLSLIHQTAT